MREKMRSDRFFRVIPGGLIAFTTLAFTTFAQSSPPTKPPVDPDFRRVTWGMSQAAVIATERDRPASISQAGGEVVVKYDAVPAPEVGGRLIYIFAGDKLVRAKYVSNAEHTEHNDFIVDFHAVEPFLTERHGKPSSERAIWDNDAFQQERLPYLDQDRALASDILPSDQNAGLSVSLGFLRLYTQRNTVRTKIVHALTGENDHIVHQIEYRSIELEAFENSVIRQNTAGLR
jgi:hypothetical protein